MRYLIRLERLQQFQVQVEAASEEDAVEKAESIPEEQLEYIESDWKTPEIVEVLS